MFLCFFAQLDVFLLGFFANFIYQAKSEVYVDGSNGVQRHSGKDVAYTNFAVDKFHYLNITPLMSVSVEEFRECGRHCVDQSSCFSFNAAAFHDMEGKILCELLPSDKYNKSSKFVSSQIFHHYGIKTPCSRYPCENNATCVAKYQDNDYECACAPGYRGTNCEIDINECSSNPCLNGGTCVDGVNSFKCNCVTYIIGARCETIDVKDPIAIYPLNAAYTTSDMMGNQPSGTASNVQLASGPDGISQGSYQFLGLYNSYIELPNNGGLDTQYSMTLCMWVYPEGKNGPLFNYKPSGSDWGVHLWVNHGWFFRPIKRNSEFLNALLEPSVKDGQWNYIAASYDYSTGVARLWVDETEVQQLNLGVYTLRTNYNVRMGVKGDDNRHFKGRIAKVQVYNIALNLGQVGAVKWRG